MYNIRKQKQIKEIISQFGNIQTNRENIVTREDARKRGEFFKGKEKFFSKKY